MNLRLPSALVAMALTPLWGLDGGQELESLQQAMAAQAVGDRVLLHSGDLDRDGVISQLEAVVWIYGHQGAARKRLPQAFARLDADADQAISRAELQQLVGRDPQRGFTVAERRRSVRPDRGPLQGFAPGTSIGASAPGSGRRSAYVFFGQQQAYIQDYDIVNGQYDPVIGVLGSGVVLEVSDVAITVQRSRR